MATAAPIIDDEEDQGGDELAPVDFPGATPTPAPAPVASPVAPVTPALQQADIAPVPTDLPAIPAAATLPVFAPKVIQGGGATRVSSPQLPAEEGAALVARNDALTEQEKAAAAQASVVRQRQAEEERRTQQASAEETERRRVEQQKIIDDHQQRLAAAMARRDATYESYKNAKYEDYWSNKTDGDRILAGISVFLGGIGGGSNLALDQVNRRVDMDFQRQKLEIEKKHQMYEDAGHDLEAVQTSKRDALADLTLKKSAALESIAAQGKAMLMRQGVPAEQAANNSAVIALDRKALDLRKQVAIETQQKVEQDTGRKVKTGGGGGAGKNHLSDLYDAAAKPGATEAPLILMAEKLGLGKNDRERAQLVRQALYDPRRIQAAQDKADAAAAKAGGSGSIAQVRANQVYGDLAEAKAAAEQSKPGLVNPDDIATISQNELRAEGGDHDVKEGGLTGLATRTARAVGLSPRSKLDGLTPEKQKQYSLAEKMVTHLAEIQPSKGMEVQKQIRDRYFPYLPGLSAEEITRREKALKEAIASQSAIQDPKKTAETRTAPPGSTPPPPRKFTAQQIAAARSANSDPEAPAAVKAKARFVLNAIGER